MELSCFDFEELDKCPWGGDSIEDGAYLYTDSMGCDVLRCEKCGIVYARRRLNTQGLAKYWRKYYSRVHTSNDMLTNQRNKMYEIDYRYISTFISKGRVLDVGCGDGSFMKFFETANYEIYGVEFGEEAADKAQKNHRVYRGEFPGIDIDGSFDLIVFRGVLQYIPNPKAYIKKAVSLLNKNGIIFITAQPNMDSFCFKLFRKNFLLAVSGIDFYGYTEPLLSDYMKQNNLRRVGEKYFYEETPYANVEENMKQVLEAILRNKRGEEIPFSSPPFWGNMMSLVYEKCC